MLNCSRLLPTVAALAALGALGLAPAQAADAPAPAAGPDAAAVPPISPATPPETPPAPPPETPPTPTPPRTRPAAPPPGDAPAPQQVEITGSTAPDSQDERRRSTASRITYGREELDRMGDSTLGEVLKRLPGVTLGGPPGRGGQVRMRGMGGGYTQILIDGQRMAPGFSLDAIAPEQIERIEIMRAPVAEFGTRAIAGTINVVMRSDFKRKGNEFRVGGGADGSHGQVGGSWLANGQTDGLGYNLSTTLFQGGQGDESDSRTLGRDATGRPTLDQRMHSRSDNQRSGLFANARLQFKLGPGSTLDLQPFFNTVRTRSDGQATLTQTVPDPTLAVLPGEPNAPYQNAQWSSRSTWQLARLNGTWLTGLAGGRLQTRFGSTLSDSSSFTDRVETGYSASTPTQPSRHRVTDSGSRELSTEMNGKFSQLLADRHSASAGYELQDSRRTDRRTTTSNGVATLTEFGENIQASTDRLAVYAQDEWDWSPSLSFYAGARWEAINTASESALDHVRNRSAVFTPLAHLVWKLPDAPRDQVRLSLTRSYRSPNTNQLISRPSISALYQDLAKPNQPSSPDTAGNPHLLPELAWGLELGVEHYLDVGGIVSANVFARKIDNLIRNVRALQTVVYASVPRWVSRPLNVGQADAAGLELEAKARLSDLWATDLPVSLRSNLTLMWSRVNQVPGPNNRLEGQPPYSANLGADWPVRGTPLTVGANLNFTPGFALQQIDNQSVRQGVKSVLDGYALWRFSPDASARLTVSNAGARRYDTGSTTTLLAANGAPASTEANDTSARSTTTVNLRAELRF